MLADDQRHGRWNYIGKIACQRVIERETEREDEDRYFFKLADTPHGLARESDEPRLPVPFRLRIPTVVGEDQFGFHEFYFYLIGERERRYEVSVKIVQHGSTPQPTLAPSENTFMVFGIHDISRIVMPRFLQIVQPFFLNDLHHQAPQQIPLGDDYLTQMAQNCIDYITNILDNIDVVMGSLFGHELYHDAEPGGQEPWVRNVVENMTGLVYKIGQRAYGGGPSGWRDRLKVLGEYPACNVCDQLGSTIQLARGLPSGDLDTYVDGGLQTHNRLYQSWAGNSTLSSRGAVHFDSLSTANTSTNRELWAKPGASIFFYKLEWQNDVWKVKNGPGQNDYIEAHTNADGTINNCSFIGHESTIIRTRSNNGSVTHIQLLDYGPNIRGNGRGRGYVGSLEHVAQESGWIPITNALTFLDQSARPGRTATSTRPARPAIPASPKKFFSVGWRPREPDNAKTLVRPLGNIELTITHNSDVLITRTRVEIEGRSSESDINVIKPITKYIAALSGMPHADQITARFKVESTPSFPGAPSPVHLLDIETDQYGKVNLISQVSRRNR